VLILKGVKDLIDDIERHRNDNLVNSRPTYVVRNNHLKKDVKWCQIVVGDIIKLQNDDFVAADLLLLATSEPHGLCYIETAELDGETNLKVKQALSETSKQFEVAMQAADLNAINEEILKLDCKIECDPPNERLSVFDGTLTWKNGDKLALDNDNLLLRGCRLRNTKWCYGLVIYAGADTKLMKNGGKTKFKQTHIDKLLNYLIFGIFVFLLTMCTICVVACGLWESFRGYNFQVFLPWDWYISENRHAGSTLIALMVFFSYLIILNTVVPISLYVSIEFIRSIQSLWINWDMKMYDDKTDTPARARTTTLNEELGQIEYIFSDKTGTLTQNIMTFNKCSINNKLYGYVYDSQGNEIEKNDKTKSIDFSWNSYYENTFKFYDKSLLEALEQNDEHCCRFFTLLCLCHTVMAEEKKGQLTYQAQSPDENALVSAARNFGFVFKTRSPKTITCSIQGEEKTFELLNFIDFNNVRKRMSVICRGKDGKIILYCKGADTMIKERLSKEYFQNFHTNDDHLNKFAEEALRTLCLAWKEIPDDIYNEWAERFHEASTSLDNRADKMNDMYEEIEQNLWFIGSTAIEDKLQDGVPECIAQLAKANIKIWVLTGDKLETAINIGYSCQLLTNEMNVYTITSNNEDTLLKELIIQRRVIEKTIASVSPNEKHSTVNNDHFTNVNNSNECEDIVDYALVVNGQSLVYALTPKCEMEFLELACLCRAVICCRVTPGQKKAVVDLVKKNKKAITLAVGDGANDVSMIKCKIIFD
jgi:phospholipid-translocating ATPase